MGLFPARVVLICARAVPVQAQTRELRQRMRYIHRNPVKRGPAGARLNGIGAAFDEIESQWTADRQYMPMRLRGEVARVKLRYVNLYSDRVRNCLRHNHSRTCRASGVLCILAMLVFSGARLNAQSGPEITFRSSADLVLIPAVVSRNGEPVRGLKREDFVIKSSGKTQTVRIFQEVEATPGDHVAISQDTTIVVVDLLNARDTRQLHRFTLAVLQQLASLGVPISVLVNGEDGLVELHPLAASNEHLLTLVRLLGDASIDPMTMRDAEFSSDMLAAIHDLTGKKIPRHDVELVRRVDFAATTLLTMEKILRVYAPLPGRKKLIWIAQQVPRYLAPLAVADSQQTTLDYYADEFRRVTRRGGLDENEVFPPFGTESELQTARVRHELLVWKGLNDENFRVMPIIDEVPDVDRRPRIPQLFSNPALVPDPCQESRAYAASHMIDPRAPDICYNDPSGCTRRAVQDRHYYVLGFYLGANPKPGIHKLEISVADKSLKVSSRAGFAVLPRRD